MTRIVQISDTHIVAPGDLTCGVVDTALALATAVETANRLVDQTDGVDMVVVTGDLTEHGRAVEYDHFARLMEPLNLPWHVLPGNHDDRAEIRDRFPAPGAGLVPGAEALNWSVTLDDFTLIGLDSQVPGHHHGHLTPETIDFLWDRLMQARGRPVLIALHHPPIASGIAEMDDGALQDTAAFGAALRAYPGPIRLICGHLHRSISTLFAGIPCQVAPGASHAVTLDQRPGMTHTLMKEPGAIMMHEWRNETLSSHYIPTGIFDGPHPFG